jgi:hypothetical protein
MIKGLSGLVKSQSCNKERQRNNSNKSQRLKAVRLLLLKQLARIRRERLQRMLYQRNSKSGTIVTSALERLLNVPKTQRLKIFGTKSLILEKDQLEQSGQKHTNIFHTKK